MTRVLRRFWLPILIVCAVAAGAFTVSNLRLVFGSNPVVVTPVGAGIAEDTDPKVVVYEVFGTGGTAVINYLTSTASRSARSTPRCPGRSR